MPHELAVQPARPELCVAYAHHVYWCPGRCTERARTAVAAGQRPAKRCTGCHVGVGSADLVVNLEDRVGERTAETGPEPAGLVPAVKRVTTRPLQLGSPVVSLLHGAGLPRQNLAESLGIGRTDLVGVARTQVYRWSASEVSGALG